MTLAQLIEKHFPNRHHLKPESTPNDLKIAIDEIIAELDTGHLRVAENKAGQWQVNQWLKKAILLSFKIYPNKIFDAGYCQFYDKLEMKYHEKSSEQFQAQGTRVVPSAIVRKGAYIGKSVILMPSYVNIGAYVDDGSMVDTWVTVGSCAQIGKNVHLSGGVGIGGVLEPLQANPTIIEDNCFIGARSEVVEGVIVEANSVLSMGVYISQSTKIYNRMTGEITYGRIPAGSVVVPGTLPSKDQSHQLYAVIIIKKIDERTRLKVDLNELLREN